MDLENTQVQMRKGILEYCILHIIARGEVYASNMLDELTAAKMIVVEGTLYPLLTRLKNAGLLEYKWVESKSGPPRKYYKLTDKGAKFLEKLTETWDEFHTVKAFGGLGKSVGGHKKKGDELIVVGEIRYSRNERDGRTYYNTDIIADEIKFI